MSDKKKKHLAFNQRLPASAVLKRRPDPEEIPTDVKPVPGDFSEKRTPTVREMGLQGDLLIVKSLLEPFRNLVLNYLREKKGNQPILWDENRVLLTVSDIKKLEEAYHRLSNLQKSIEWLEARVNSTTDPIFKIDQE
ncbi:MAG: hypothetical protein GF334_04980 [Candidatus Altiarchaeales archaeon]|nr:hypothetical protein [Candidatus Altiarchaeales archaeon]